MANKTLFQSLRGALLPKTDAVNEAGGPAYALAPKQALAQYAATGCLNSTFYASANDQLQKVLALANEVDAPFIAKTGHLSFCRTGRGSKPTKNLNQGVRADLACASNIILRMPPAAF